MNKYNQISGVKNMAEYQTAKNYVDSSQSIDIGLRTHMNKVYGLMAVAMIITGAVAFAVGTTPALIKAIFGTWLQWVVMLAPLGVVFMFSARIHSMSVATAQLVFWVFAALIGLSISYIFVVYTGISIAQTFFTTAIAFAALSLYGYTTKRDLTAMGSFLFIGLVGIIVASIANWFLQSPVMHLAISAIGVLIFAGLTAYDTQNIKNTYLQFRTAYGEEYAEKMGVMGALSLYLNFLNMFMFLLQFMGNRD
jgi:FtsH-binding integral membrane protein